MSLRYPELNATSRRQIWVQFLGEEYVKGFSSEELDQVAEVALNGRQIKDVLRTARLLARTQDAQLNYEHIKSILTLREGRSISGSDI